MDINIQDFKEFFERCIELNSILYIKEKGHPVFGWQLEMSWRIQEIVEYGTDEVIGFSISIPGQLRYEDYFFKDIDSIYTFTNEQIYPFKGKSKRQPIRVRDLL